MDRGEHSDRCLGRLRLCLLRPVRLLRRDLGLGRPSLLLVPPVCLRRPCLGQDPWSTGWLAWWLARLLRRLPVCLLRRLAAGSVWPVCLLRRLVRAWLEPAPDQRARWSCSLFPAKSRGRRCTELWFAYLSS